MICLHIASPKLINVKSPLDSLNFDHSQLYRGNEKFGYGNENFNSRGDIGHEFR